MATHDDEHVHGIRVVRDGPREAPTMVLVHGSGSSGSSWGPVVPMLAGGYHVVRVDLPGHGQSPPATSYGVPEQAASVARALDELDLRPVAVVGHSSGGYIATALAERRPDLVGSLALIGSGPDLDALLPQPAVLRVLLGPPLGPLLWRVRSDRMLRQAVTAVCARPVDVPDELIADVRGIGYGTFRAVLRHNTAYVAERSVPARLTGLGVPVLVVFGGADPRWDPASAHRYGTVPDTRVELLPGVGHFPMLEAPEATGEALLRFAADLRHP